MTRLVNDRVVILVVDMEPGQGLHEVCGGLRCGYPVVGDDRGGRDVGDVPGLGAQRTRKRLVGQVRRVDQPVAPKAARPRQEGTHGDVDVADLSAGSDGDGHADLNGRQQMLLHDRVDHMASNRRIGCQEDPVHLCQRRDRLRVGGADVEPDDVGRRVGAPRVARGDTAASPAGAVMGMG